MDDYGTIGGGGGNRVGNGNSKFNDATYATISGGNANSASGFYATVVGGRSNVASAPFASVLGGTLNTASGQFSVAAGRLAKATQTGSFVWADSNALDFTSTANNQFNVRATGGTRFVSAINTTNGAPTAGVQLPAGSGAWASLSDRDAKANITAVDSVAILDKVASLPLSLWNYKTQDASIRHVGPMAQDFAAAFGVGEDDRHISTVDADGVALAAIQGLYAQGKAKDAQIAALQERLDVLESTHEAGNAPVVVASNGLMLSWGMVALGIGSLLALLIMSSVSLTLLLLRSRGMVKDV